ncbi:MAG: DUF6090 family protein [Winogradskyella sp.]|uniref:DUF6090 family protein n=1 Tax=Winogradskyella sp. TaxID=1883156 RepID=UPI00385E5BCA
MIKLFRKIRYNLMETGKTSRYFKYAIGEIILVVIGILIALQINNWNEERKETINQNNLFNNLKIDFNARLIELEELQDAKNDGVMATHDLNLMINKKQLDEPQKIYDLLARTFNGFLFNEQFKMLDVLFYTGTINNIKNERLKRLLVEWPQNVEEMLEEQRIYNNSYPEYVKLIGNYVPLRSVNENFKFRGYELPKGQPVTQNADFDSLFSNHEFENILAERELLTHIMIIDNKVLIKSAKEIIELLESEY